MLRRVLGKFRFSLRTLLVLMLGIAIGLALNVHAMQRFVGLAANETYMTSLPTYRIEPPDVLVVNISGASTSSSGEHLVGPDGTINLGAYGQVPVSGKTISEARDAVMQAVAPHIESPQVEVDVSAYNSKCYYVVTEGAGPGDQLHRVPITGNETVLDAIAHIGGLSRPDDVLVWIARPQVNGAGPGKVLSVQWKDIVQGATATNYQVLPGDRVFVSLTFTAAAMDWLRSYFR